MGFPPRDFKSPVSTCFHHPGYTRRYANPLADPTGRLLASRFGTNQT